MAITSIRQDHVIAEHAFFDRADAFDGFLLAFVAQIGFQLHTDATQCFKGVFQ